MNTRKDIAMSIEASRRVINAVRETDKPIIGLHSYHSDPDTIVSTRLDQEISVMRGLPRDRYLIAYAGPLGHPGTEATLELCGGATRIDSPGSVREQLFTDAFISTSDAPSPQSIVAYNPITHQYESLLGKPTPTWPDITDRIIIEKDHHSHRQLFNPRNNLGYALLCDHMGSATAIATLQLKELINSGHSFEPDNPVGLMAAIKYAIWVDTQGFNGKQMSADDIEAVQWLDHHYFTQGHLARVRTGAFLDLCKKPLPNDWTTILDEVTSSEAYESARSVFIADLGVVHNRMIIPYIADHAFNAGEVKQAVVIFGLYAERDSDIQSNALLFSGRSKGFNGELKKIFRHNINLIVQENGKNVETCCGGGRDTGLDGGITMCGNAIPLYCDPNETTDDLVDACMREEYAYIPRIVEGFRDIAHIDPCRGAFYSRLQGTSIRFEQTFK
ncbi:hypothetical protein HY641_01600 [Candidatus Woesearchaeota archaeon]|nr:hypothetical protein [Candidatus Woesearchaeota archaeon]